MFSLARILSVLIVQMLPGYVGIKKVYYLFLAVQLNNPLELDNNQS